MRWWQWLVGIAIGYIIAVSDLPSLTVEWLFEIQAISHKRALLGFVLLIAAVYWIVIFIPLDRAAAWERKHTGDYPYKHVSAFEQLRRRDSF